MVLNASKINETGSNLNGTLGSQGLECVLHWVGGSCVKVNAVHINESALGGGKRRVGGKASVLQSVVIPGGGTVLTTEDKNQAGVKELEGLRPLNSLGSVDLLGHLLDLPGTPALVAKSPVLDVVRLRVAVLATEVGIVGVPSTIAVLNPGHGLSEGASGHVQGEVRLSTELSAPLHELISTEGVWLNAQPSELGAIGRTR